MSVPVINVFGNSTILFVIELIFTQQDYRTINFLSEDRFSNDFPYEIIQIASDSLIRPISHFTFGETNILRSFYEEPILNVLFLNHLDNTTNVDLVKRNILPDDVTLLLPGPNVGETEERFWGMWMNLSAKVISLTQNLTIFLNEAFESEFNSKVDLSCYDVESTRNFIRRMFSMEYFPRQHKEFTLFFQFFPPKSSVGTVGKRKDFVLIGPDGSIAEAIIKALKVKPIFSSDFALSYPDYESWREESVISPRLIYQNYYPEVMTKNIMETFNKRQVLLKDHP